MKTIPKPLPGIPRTTPKIRKAKMRRRISALVSALFSFTPALDVLAQPKAEPGELQVPSERKTQGTQPKDADKGEKADDDSKVGEDWSPEESPSDVITIDMSGEEDAQPEKKPAATKKPKPKPKAVEKEPEEQAEGNVLAGDPDPALSAYDHSVTLSGQRRKLISLDNHFDLGGHVIATEAGQAAYGTLMYDLRADETDLVHFDTSMNAGGMWFDELGVPFAALKVHPSLHLWNFKLAYHGTAAYLAELASFHTYHSAGLGYSQPIGDRFRLRLGTVTGGAVSFPRYDNIFMNLTFGASVEILKVPGDNSLLFYGMPVFYFAAPDPIKSAYVGHYRPMFQNIEFGAQYMFDAKQWTTRLTGDVGTITQSIEGRLTRTINFSDTIEGDIYGSVGATHWSPELGNMWEPRILAGAVMVFGGEKINSTNSVTFEHIQAGGIRDAETDFPTRENLGPYGFGRSGNPKVDDTVNLAKQRILGSGSFEEFSAYYAAASTSEVIMTARFIGAFMSQVAYAHGAMDALHNAKFFDSEVQRVANATPDQIFSFWKEYINFYENNPPGTPLPARLRDGIAICAGTSEMQARFMRAHFTGEDQGALVAQVNHKRGPHVVSIGLLGDSVALLDYGRLYAAKTFYEAMRYYARDNNSPIWQAQVWTGDKDDVDGDGNTVESVHLGTVVMPEGRLLHKTVGVSNTDFLKREFLGVR